MLNWLSRRLEFYSLILIAKDVASYTQFTAYIKS